MINNNNNTSNDINENKINNRMYLENKRWMMIS